MRKTAFYSFCLSWVVIGVFVMLSVAFGRNGTALSKTLVAPLNKVCAVMRFV